MKISLVLVSFLLATQAWAADYPTSPDPKLTPGSLCDSPDTHRYPEQIAYCNRSVDSGTKAAIIKTYDEKLGYRVGEMSRKDFKIDHYIPLCMGGSNHVTNLWPQHVSISQQTDMLEMYSCQKMSEGKLRQAEAVDIMKRAKNDLKQAQALLHYVQGL